MSASYKNKIAICMATYNGQLFINEQIDSILNQIDDDAILFVSDDGSQDKTVEILKSYGDSLVLLNSDRKDIVRNFEFVLRVAYEGGAAFFILADQDDVWIPGRYKIIKEKLKYSSLIMLDGLCVDASKNSLNKSVFDLVNFKSGFFNSFVSNKYVGCCLSFRRELLDVALPFPLGVKWHDWFIALIAELMFKTEAVNIQTILYRRHSANATQTGLGSSSNVSRKLFDRLCMSYALIVSIFRYFRLKFGNFLIF